MGRGRSATIATLSGSGQRPVLTRSKEFGQPIVEDLRELSELHRPPDIRPRRHPLPQAAGNAAELNTIEPRQRRASRPPRRPALSPLREPQLLPLASFTLNHPCMGPGSNAHPLDGHKRKRRFPLDPLEEEPRPALNRAEHSFTPCRPAPS